MIKTAYIANTTDDPYKLLAAAIIERALLDYKLACVSKNYEDKQELRKFFRSDWFDVLSDLDGDVLMAQIERMAR